MYVMGLHHQSQPGPQPGLEVVVLQSQVVVLVLVAGSPVVVVLVVVLVVQSPDVGSDETQLV